MSWISLFVSTVWVAGFWAMSRDRSDTWAITMVGMAASLIAVGLAAGALWPQAMAGYPGDSFWTLSWFGRTGVAGISIGSSVILFSLFAAKTRLILRRKTQGTGTAWLLIDIALGVTVFAVVFSISPQVFYSFYRLIISDLPQQWVIDGLVNWGRLWDVAQLQQEGSLADHLAGLILWAVLPFKTWLHLRSWWRGD